MLPPRYYDPMEGRFIQKDPIGFAGGEYVNLYAYVQNNPVNKIDPFGLEPVSRTEGYQIVLTALNNGWLGTPYELVGAGTIKGKQGDCSGTTWGIYNEAGFQYDYSMANELGNNPRFISLGDIPGAEPQPGDAGWKPGHVVIYIGDGNYVSASTSAGKLIVTPYYNGKIQKWYRYDKP